MPSTYTGSGIELIGDGEQSGSWGNTTNNNLEIIDRLISQAGVIALSGTTHTLSLSDGTLSDGQYAVLVFGGAPSGTNTVTINPNDAKRVFIIRNSSGQSVVLTQGSGGNVTVADGKTAIVYCDGAGTSAEVVNVSEDFVSATLSAIGALAVTDGNFIVGNGTTWVAESGNTAIASLGITATASELNTLDGITASTAELNIMDGVTATTAEINKLDGLTATTAELNIMDGVTATTAEINKLDGLLASTAELNILDGATVTTAELNRLDGLTATATELNKLDGATVTTTEINYLDGVTSNVQTQLNAKADDATTISAGGGLTGGGSLAANRTISHADTSSQASVNNSGSTFIQDISLDTYGHVTNINSATVPVFGDGQTWQSVSRSLGTTYTNTTGKAIMVNIRGTGAGNTLSSITAVINGVSMVVAEDQTASNTRIVASIIVPIGATYRFTMSNSSLSTWHELR